MPSVTVTSNSRSPSCLIEPLAGGLRGLSCSGFVAGALSISAGAIPDTIADLRVFGGGDGTRTHDLLTASQMLYQLSYTPGVPLMGQTSHAFRIFTLAWPDFVLIDLELSKRLIKVNVMVNFF